MFLAPTVTPARWSVDASGDIAAFSRASDVAPASHLLPRLWSGHGLALPQADLPGFRAVLARTMKQAAYWKARAAEEDPHAGDAAVWSEPWLDLEDDFLYFAGPCGPRDGMPGYRPATTFTVALPHVRGLRIRVTAYLHAQAEAQPRIPAARRR